MKKESEKTTEIYLRTQIEALGGVCWKWVSPMVKGVPDRICLLPGGHIFFVEVKSEGRILDGAQCRRANDLKKRGFRSYIADTKFKVDQIIKAEIRRHNDKATDETAK